MILSLIIIYLLVNLYDLIAWFANFVNYMASNIVPPDLSFHQMKNFMNDVQKFFWDEPFLYMSCANGFIWHCLTKVEMLSVLEACYSSPIGGNRSGIQIAQRILKCDYYWSTIKQDDQ